MKNSSGQALLIVLLSLSVVLVVSMSLLSRSITDINLTGRDDESGRAFSAAEAGIESALVTAGFGQVITGTFEDGRSSFSAQVSGIAQDSQIYSVPQGLSRGSSATIWFVSHSSSGALVCDGGAGLGCFIAPTSGASFQLCFGSKDISMDDDPPAVELSVYYDENAPDVVNSGDYTGVSVAKFTFDPDAGRAGTNNFSAASEGGCKVSDDYKYSVDIDMSATEIGCIASAQEGCMLMATARVLYSLLPQPVGVNVYGDSTLPAQGKKIVSTGSSGTSVSATRKVEVYQTFGEIPFVFDAAVFSVPSITKL